MLSRDPRKFGRKVIDREAERSAAAKVSLACVLGALVAFTVGYFLEDRGAAGFAFIFGFGLCVVAWAAAYDAMDLNSDDFI